MSSIFFGVFLSFFELFGAPPPPPNPSFSPTADEPVSFNGFFYLVAGCFQKSWKEYIKAGLSPSTPLAPPRASHLHTFLRKCSSAPPKLGDGQTISQYTALIQGCSGSNCLLRCFSLFTANQRKPHRSCWVCGGGWAGDRGGWWVLLGVRRLAAVRCSVRG